MLASCGMKLSMWVCGKPGSSSQCHGGGHHLSLVGWFFFQFFFPFFLLFFCISMQIFFCFFGFFYFLFFLHKSYQILNVSSIFKLKSFCSQNKTLD